MVRHRSLLVFAVGTVVAAACSNGTSSPNSTASSPASPTGSPTPVAQAYTVHVDAGKTDPQISALAYFPKAVSVHPGDTISFALQDTGEPHTVALGTFVDAAWKAAQTAKDNAPPPPALKKVPDLLPQGPGDAYQAAAQPCVLTAGAPAVKDISKPCADTKPGEFDGTQELFTSGWLAPDTPFSVKVADTAKPGTYHFYCQLHGPQAMSGTLTVAAAGTNVPAPADVATTASTELGAFVDSLKKAASGIAHGTAAHAFAGAFDQKVQNGQVNAFGPATLSIPVGGTVAWQVFGPHSISFNPTADAEGLRVAAPDGSVHLNAKAAGPAGGPGQGKGTTIDGGRWNGSGFHSSGFILSFPPDLVTYKLTFTKAGTYPYRCLIHSDMEGTVKVG